MVIFLSTLIIILLSIIFLLYLNFEFLIEKLSNLILEHFHEYNKKIRPERIILIRHGQSEANIDDSLYLKIPDNKISLTEKGKEQAREAGKKLKEIIGEGSIKFYISPYLRTRQTFENIYLSFKKNKIKIIIDPRLREQEFGNFHQFNDKILKDLGEVGKFYYRFTNGESGADVFDRSSQFLDRLFRDIKNINKKKYENIVIVCHGLFMRLFMKNFKKMSIEEFDKLATPRHCEFWVLEKNNKGKYNLISFLQKTENNLL